MIFSLIGIVACVFSTTKNMFVYMRAEISLVYNTIWNLKKKTFENFERNFGFLARKLVFVTFTILEDIRQI